MSHTVRTALIAIALAIAGAAAGGLGRAADDAELAGWARDLVAKNAAKRIDAPDFGAGHAWLNVARPLTRAKDLAGKVVVMDFWCYCCINCMHILPDLDFLERKYAGQAFAVVGVHSAKFQNEKDADRVREAVVRYEIRHPVVVDDDFGIWNAYGARGWPHLVVVGPTGHLLAVMGGEGHRAELDAIVGAALAQYGATPGVLDARPLPIALERARRPGEPLAFPGKVAVDAAAGRLYVSDSNHHRIVETDLDGRFLRAFGDGTRGFVDGPAATARFDRPQGLAVDGGVLWVADTENHALRRVTLADGGVTTAAGTGRQGYDHDRSGPGREIDLSSPWDVLPIGGALYVAMAGNHQLWRYDPATGRVGPFAGDGSERKLDAARPRDAAFAQPSGLAWDGTWLYVADSESSSIRRVRLPDGPVETLAGGDADPTNLFAFGLVDGRGDGARLQHPLGVLVVDGRLWVADTYNHALRTIDPATGAVTTAFGDGTAGDAEAPARFREPAGLAAAGGRLYVADTNNHRIRVVDLATRAVRTLPRTSIPLPQAAARAGGASAWPEPSDAARATAPAVTLGADAAVRLTVRLALPEGWHLTEDAPSALRVEGAARVHDAPILGLATTVALGPLPATASALRVRLLYYVCQDGGSCRFRAAEVTVPDALAAGGGAAVVVADAFVP
jgi:sugar lactone lactonase YvrE